MGARACICSAATFFFLLSSEHTPPPPPSHSPPHAIYSRISTLLAARFHRLLAAGGDGKWSPSLLLSAAEQPIGYRIVSVCLYKSILNAKKPQKQTQYLEKITSGVQHLLDLLLTFHAAHTRVTARQSQLHTSHATLVWLSCASGRNSMFALLEGGIHDSPFGLYSGI